MNDSGHACPSVGNVEDCQFTPTVSKRLSARKRAARCRRPQSREETPNEGHGSYTGGRGEVLERFCRQLLIPAGLARLTRLIQRSAFPSLPTARLIRQNVATSRSGVIWSVSAKASIVYSPLIRKVFSRDCASAYRGSDDANRRPMPNCRRLPISQSPAQPT
jgi:hypothetical protein